MIAATFSSKDQNWQSGTTTYWFVLDGTDYGTNKTFDNETFGIVDCAGEKSVVEFDGAPVHNEYVDAIVLRVCKITDEMIYA
jgi:hypothetical protein